MISSSFYIASWERSNDESFARRAPQPGRESISVAHLDPLESPCNRRRRGGSRPGGKRDSASLYPSIRSRTNRRFGRFGTNGDNRSREATTARSLYRSAGDPAVEAIQTFRSPPADESSKFLSQTTYFFDDISEPIQKKPFPSGETRTIRQSKRIESNVRSIMRRTSKSRNETIDFLACKSSVVTTESITRNILEILLISILRLRRNSSIP